MAGADNIALSNVRSLLLLSTDKIETTTSLHLEGSGMVTEVWVLVRSVTGPVTSTLPKFLYLNTVSDFCFGKCIYIL